MRATAPRDAISDMYIAHLADVRLPDLERPAAIALRTDAERRRYGRLRHAEARRQFLAARQVARAVAGRALSVPPQAVALAQRCPHCSSDEHGRPLPEQGVWLSWSHSNAAVVVAVSHSAIGVDVEAIGAFGDGPTDIEAMMCTADEAARLPGDPPSRRRALARLWTAKEALVKVGECDLDEMRRTHVGVARPAGRPWQGNQRTWYLTAVESRGVICTAAAAAAVRAHTVDAAGLPGWPS